MTDEKKPEMPEMPMLEVDCPNVACYVHKRSCMRYCVDCNGTGIVLTPFGAKVLELCTRWLDVSIGSVPTSEGYLSRASRRG